jgi:membrane-bound lytic murein transglycosylase B
VAETQLQGASVLLNRNWLIVGIMLSGPVLAQDHPGAGAFVDRAATEHGLDAAEVTALLEAAKFQQSIVDAMSRPAEGKPWHQYRPIFITDQRIAEGVAFWNKHEALVAQASEKFQVDPQVIMAIIGVETFYGRITGSYKVLDALATLSFYYPKALKRDRSEFFSNELLEFMLLGREEHLPLGEVTGSYAGAMGMGQFIPSSYRAYAVDFDDDGERDLWRSIPDAVGSVANYLHVHGWEMGGPVTRRAIALDGADMGLPEKGDYNPDLTVMALHDKGFQSAADLDPERQAAVLELEESDHATYWLTFKNFYVITRYNRSPLYAMAVFQLSEALLAARDDA